MKYPEFFDKVERITLKDPLSEVLGTFEDGEITFSYLDVVKCAGHSCPTVAGAYLMTKAALKALYPNTLPIRGNIKVSVSGSKEEGVYGVIASVISNITGASDNGGFKGLNSNFSRNNLLNFGEKFEGVVKFERIDTNESVIVSYDHSVVVPNPKMNELMQKMMQGICDKEEKKEFGKIWQEKVCEILTNSKSYDGLLKIR